MIKAAMKMYHDDATNEALGDIHSARRLLELNAKSCPNIENREFHLNLALEAIKEASARVSTLYSIVRIK